MSELDKYKEAFRIACHNLMMAHANIFRDSIIKKIEGGEIFYTDEYYSQLEEMQSTFLEMATENLKEQNNE